MHVRRARHRFDAAADEHVAVADGDRVGGGVDRLQPGAAQPIDGQAADLDREAGQEHGHPRDVPVVLAGLVGAAEDDVLDEGGVDAGAVDDGAQHERRQVVGSDARERAAVAADRRPDGLDDPGLADGTVLISGHRGDRRGAAGSGRDASGNPWREGRQRAVGMRRPEPQCEHDVVARGHSLIRRETHLLGDRALDPLTDPIRTETPRLRAGELRIDRLATPVVVPVEPAARLPAEPSGRDQPFLDP